MNPFKKIRDGIHSLADAITHSLLAVSDAANDAKEDWTWKEKYEELHEIHLFILQQKRESSDLADAHIKMLDEKLAKAEAQITHLENVLKARGF